MKFLKKNSSEGSSPLEPKRSKGLLYRLFGLATIAYGLAVNIPLAINIVLGEGWKPIAFYNTFAHLLWFPAFGLLAITLVWGRWALATLMLMPVLAFTLAFGGRYMRYLPEGDKVTAGDNASWYVDVMTYNIQWRREQYTETIRIIAESGADIVALQELSFDAAERIEAGLKDVYPYMALHPQRNGVLGQGLLSRYPIVDSEFWQAEGVFGAQQAFSQFEADSHSATIAIHNVHPYNPATGSGFFNPSVRTTGIKNILARAAADTTPYRLLVGDFNMPELSDDFALVNEDWHDVYSSHGSGMGITFQFKMRRLLQGRLIPLLRLDYIFIDGLIYARDAWVIQDSGGSDHRPVMARLWLDLTPNRS